MNYTKLSLITAILVTLVCDVRGDDALSERQAKFMKFNGISDLGKFNIERVLSQWNRSHAEDFSRRPRVEELKSTPQPAKKGEFATVNDLYSLFEKFSSSFKKCLFAQRKRIIQDPIEGKSIVFKCFRVELVKELRGVINETDSITFLNGYVELEKLQPGKMDKPRKPHKKATKRKVPGVEVPVQSDVSDSVLNEIFSNPKSENGTGGGIFSSYGQYLIQEISDDLDNEEEEVRTLKDSVMDSDFLSVISDMSKKFALRFNLFPGVSAKMRSHSTGVTFDLELDDLSPFGDDDDDDDKKKRKRWKGVKDSSEEDSEEDEEEDDAEGDDDDDLRKDGQIRGEEEEDDDEEEEESGKGKGKGKGKKGKQKEAKKKMKMLKKLIPYLLIPMMIQAVMLPIAFKILMFFAIKALLAGKIALLLVAINLIKNANFKSDEDEYIERVGQEHYGYGNGEEYGSWVNGKRAFDGSAAQTFDQNHPYRAYAQTEKQE